MSFFSRLQLWVLSAVWYSLSVLPLWLLYFMSDILALLLAYVIRYRHKVIERNLAKSFPEKSEAERRKLQWQFYRFFCNMWAENFKFATISKKRIMQRMEFVGMDAIIERVKRGQGLAILLGHYGNWEWVASMALWAEELREGNSFGQVYHPLKNKAMNSLMLRIRGRMGSARIPMKETLRWIINRQREGHPPCVGYASDQAPKWENIHLWVNFLNQETPVFTGVERIARKQHQFVVYVDIQPLRRGYYRNTVHILSEDASKEEPGDIMRRFFQCLEATIRRAPQYWLWSHNRWKRTREEFDRRFQVINGRVVPRKEAPDGDSAAQ